MPPRRKVLLLMEATIGGTRRHLGQLALGLPADRFEVTVAASAEREPNFRDDLERFRGAGREVVEIPMVRSPDLGRDRAHLRTIRELLRSRRFDLVHTHSSKAGALGRYASLREGIGKRVHTPHTFAFAFRGGFSPPARALFYGVELLLGRATHRLIAVSPSEADQARRLKVAARERVRVVENGVDAAPFLAAPPREKAREVLGLDPRAPLAVIVALQNPAKGQLEALEALARIPEGARPRLALVGGVSDPNYGAEVRAAVERLRLGPWVRDAGHRDDVPLWLAACDLALCPSRWEGMPYAVLEAMASARAVLATATNGARDAVLPGTTGEIVPVGDAAALARALERLAGDRAQCQRYGEAGRARVLERYSIPRMIEGTAAVYEEALAS
jgi:glycosyltransferase involved in cell wall biosynthesis